jgi:predicted nucleotidyltransferase
MTNLQTILPLLAQAGVEFVIIGGVAATIHGSSHVTNDLDICYARSRLNLTRLANALAPFHPRLRGAPAELPFIWDAETLRHGLNFTLVTDLGDLDLLGEVTGIGTFEPVRAASIIVKLFGVKCAVLSLDGLIVAKRAAGRLKDQLILPELEALREATQDATEFGSPGEKEQG